MTTFSSSLVKLGVGTLISLTWFQVLSQTVKVDLVSAAPVQAVERKFSRATINAAGKVDPFRPVPLVSGLPLVQTKGIVKGDGFLYIADTGKDGIHNVPAKIWKLNPKSKELSVFYQGPLLVNAKWLFFNPASDKRPAELFVSDYGVEPSPRTPGTGEGAKVFALPVDANGNALAPRVLHQGPPFRSPEGITVVGDNVVVADWAAGPETTLLGRPGTFNRGMAFRIPIEGGKPVQLFPDQLWVTLIAACRYEGEDGNAYLRFIDIDGGRAHKEGAYLPQSGLVAFYRARILSEFPMTLGGLERVAIRELMPLNLDASTLRAGDRVNVELHDGARFTNDQNRTTIRISKKGTPYLPEMMVESDSEASSLRATVEIIRSGKTIGRTLVQSPKIFDIARPMDNKHGGAVRTKFTINMPRLMATADGTSRGLYLIPANGGVPATLWRGDPFVQPMGVQYSWDGSTLWVTDQSAGPDGTAAVFEVRLPTLAERMQMFREVRIQKKILLP
jgi:hypothetical protein